MASICVKCLKRNDCESIKRTFDFYHLDCKDFILDSFHSNRKRYVLVHRYNESGFYSIVAFSDSPEDLEETARSHPRYGSSHHSFSVVNNNRPIQGVFLTDIKDKCLINICKNVAEYLAVGEFAMLKKSYFNASSWFEKAKNSASLGAEIIYNY